MIRIAILGNIGSGKTFISKLFGFPVFNADEEVKNIYLKNNKCYINLKKKFPKYVTSFPIKKKVLINIILENKKNIKIINQIVHPIVRRKMTAFLKRNKKTKAVVLDVPLFLENKLNDKNDYLIFVNSKIRDIKKKLNQRNSSYKLVKILKNLQISCKIKKKKANFIINNNFKQKTVKKNVILIKNKILNNERDNSRY